MNKDGMRETNVNLRREDVEWRKRCDDDDDSVLRGELNHKGEWNHWHHEDVV